MPNRTETPTTSSPGRELMAKHISTDTVEGRTIALSTVLASDVLNLSLSVPYAHVAEVKPSWTPELVHLSVSIGGKRGWIAMPADLEYVLIEGHREVRVPCDCCKRTCLWVMDLATSSATPSLVICEECDASMTAEAVAEKVGA